MIPTIIFLQLIGAWALVLCFVFIVYQLKERKIPQELQNLVDVVEKVTATDQKVINLLGTLKQQIADQATQTSALQQQITDLQKQIADLQAGQGIDPAAVQAQVDTLNTQNTALEQVTQ